MIQRVCRGCPVLQLCGVMYRDPKLKARLLHQPLCLHVMHACFTFHTRIQKRLQKPASDVLLQRAYQKHHDTTHASRPNGNTA